MTKLGASTSANRERQTRDRLAATGTIPVGRLERPNAMRYHHGPIGEETNCTCSSQVSYAATEYVIDEDSLRI